MCAQLLQLCPTLCNPMDCSPPGSSVHGILQARILEWVVIPSSRASSQPRDSTCVSFISSIAGRFFTSQAPGKHKVERKEEKEWRQWKEYPQELDCRKSRASVFLQWEINILKTWHYIFTEVNAERFQVDEEWVSRIRWSESTEPSAEFASYKVH